MELSHTYQARIQPGNCILLVALLCVAIYFMWEVNGIMIAISLLLMLLIIERTIHTEYRLNKESLTIHRGRFAKDKVIPLSEIKRVERVSKIRINRKALNHFLIIVYGNEQTCAIIPRNEEDFVSQLMKVKSEK